MNPSTAELEARIQQLEDKEAIRRLKHEIYCGLVDHGVCTGNPSLIAPLAEHFTDDFEADFTKLGVFRGVDAVKFFTEGVPSLLSWCQHRVTNESIDVAGDAANAVWYVFAPVVAKRGWPFGEPGPVTIIGRYREAYARIGGVWKWRRIRAELDVVAATATAWADARWTGQ